MQPRVAGPSGRDNHRRVNATRPNQSDVLLTMIMIVIVIDLFLVYSVSFTVKGSSWSALGADSSSAIEARKGEARSRICDTFFSASLALPFVNH